MDIQIEDIGACRKRIQVKVPVERIATHIDEMYKWANHNIQMKGFRPGKVPRKVLEQRVGPQLLVDAKKSLVEETFREALQEQTLDVVGSPRIDVDEEPLVPDQELGYSVELDVRPEVTVGKVKDVEIDGHETQANDEDLQAALQSIADQRRQLTAVEEEIDEGDFAKADLTYSLDGEVVVKKEGLQINTRIPVVGTDPEEFSAKLKGMKKGDAAKLPINYPDKFEKEEVRGKDGELEITVHEVIRFQSPAIDDELAKGYKFDDLEALKKDVLEKVQEQKETHEHGRREEAILEVLYTENPFDLPEGLVEEESQHRLSQYSDHLREQGADDEVIEKQLATAKEEVSNDSRLAVRNLFLVDAIAKKEKLFVTESDVEQQIGRIAAENQATVEDVKKYLEEKNLIGELRMDLVNRKVRDFLRATAKISDSKKDS